MTSTDAHVTIDCYDAEEYTNEDWPECLFTTTDPDIPIPQEGDCIQFGWIVDEDGEKQDRWHFNANNPDDDMSYERSQFYRVVDRLLHYHNRRETNTGKMVTDKTEVTITLLVEETASGEIPF